MILGKYGGVLFQVDAKKVITWQAFSRSSTARYARHEVLHRKEALEFTGQNISSISIDIQLNAHLNISPMAEIDKLQEMLASGKSYPLTVGGRMHGRFALEKIDENWKTADGHGRIIVAEVALSLLEDA